MQSLSVSLSGQHVRLDCPDSDTERFAIRALGDTLISKISRDTPGLRRLSISLNQTSTILNWAIIDHHRQQTQSGQSIGDFAYILTDILVFHFADLIRSSYCIHAGAIELGGRVVLVAGPSGAGKSTLIATLVARGGRYISDELSVIAPNANVTGFPRPIQIKPHGLETVKPLLKQTSQLLHGRLATGVPSTALNPLEQEPTQGQKLGLIIFPEYKRTTSRCLNKLSPAKAGQQLMQCFVNARHMQGHGFTQLMGLIQAVPAYSYQYSTLDNDSLSTFTKLYT